MLISMKNGKRIIYESLEPSVRVIGVSMMMKAILRTNLVVLLMQFEV